jgi:hypothetical protein
MSNIYLIECILKISYREEQSTCSVLNTFFLTSFPVLKTVHQKDHTASNPSCLSYAVYERPSKANIHDLKIQGVIMELGHQNCCDMHALPKLCRVLVAAWRVGTSCWGTTYWVSELILIFACNNTSHLFFSCHYSDGNLQHKGTGKLTVTVLGKVLCSNPDPQNYNFLK